MEMKTYFFRNKLILKKKMNRKKKMKGQRYSGFNLFFGIAVVKSYPFATLP